MYGNCSCCCAPYQRRDNTLRLLAWTPPHAKPNGMQIQPFSYTSTHKVAMARSGVLPALARLCGSGDRERQIHAVAAIANIAEMVEGRTQKRMIEEGCIKPLLALVDSPDVSSGRRGGGYMLACARFLAAFLCFYHMRCRNSFCVIISALVPTTVDQDLKKIVIGCSGVVERCRTLPVLARDPSWPVEKVQFPHALVFLEEQPHGCCQADKNYHRERKHGVRCAHRRVTADVQLFCSEAPHMKGSSCVNQTLIYLACKNAEQPEE